MTLFEKQGNDLINEAKKLVLEFMNSSQECSPEAQGMKQAEIFRALWFRLG